MLSYNAESKVDNLKRPQIVLQILFHYQVIFSLSIFPRSGLRCAFLNSSGNNSLELVSIYNDFRRVGFHNR